MKSKKIIFLFLEKKMIEILFLFQTKIFIGKLGDWTFQFLHCESLFFLQRV